MNELRFTAGLKHLESFRNLNILTIYSLYIQETILYVKKKCYCTVNKQIHTHNTKNKNDYHKYGHNLELYNSKPSVTGCIFYNKLPNNIKQIENNNHVGSRTPHRMFVVDLETAASSSW
jgi:hypothetical protein